MDTRDEALLKAITHSETSSALALAIGVRPQAISQWKRVPVARVLAVEAATGIPRHELRPDIYPPPTVPDRRLASNSNLSEALP
ncbi:helix-turn-helix domain-containing protein [Starkeya sp. ORNL1]|uniref:transcriptional regulator n=1 Tax=Starkeya sp. ORNL1 TaxID=2709380 RepID=UPI001463AE51|nr:Cro/CI family transcriptional regulator [Starkeya sp. ORNL1]QJP14696.1 helix-turn-helix domain-containing protein [Starkeya sp. ORNL1]